jgi:putative addiction module killer protein
MNPMQILAYADLGGNEPFTEWLRKLRDAEGRNRILARLRRIQQGNYGDCKNLDSGVYELRLNFGPGYRVYFGKDGETIVILLCGGDKSSQSQDIMIAKRCWKEYLDNAKNENS